MSRPRDAKADAAILEAALDLFIEGGLAGAGIDPVAKRAGVTRATVYRRWPDKVGLLAAAIAHAHAGAAEAFGADWRTQPLDVLLDALVAHGPALMAAERERKLLAALVGSTAETPALMQAYWDAQIGPRRAAFMTKLPAGVDGELVQDLLNGALMYKLLVRQEPGDLGPYLERLLKVLGLRA